jgi:hypothetical protein
MKKARIVVLECDCSITLEKDVLVLNLCKDHKASLIPKTLISILKEHFGIETD